MSIGARVNLRIPFASMCAHVHVCTHRGMVLCRRTLCRWRVVTLANEASNTMRRGLGLRTVYFQNRWTGPDPMIHQQSQCLLFSTIVFRFHVCRHGCHNLNSAFIFVVIFRAVACRSYLCQAYKAFDSSGYHPTQGQITGACARAHDSR